MLTSLDVARRLMGQMAVCCQNLMLGALSSCIVLSLLVGALFKKFGLFLNMLCITKKWSTDYSHVFWFVFACIACANTCGC